MHYIYLIYIPGIYISSGGCAITPKEKHARKSVRRTGSCSLEESNRSERRAPKSARLLTVDASCGNPYRHSVFIPELDTLSDTDGFANSTGSDGDVLVGAGTRVGLSQAGRPLTPSRVTMPKLRSSPKTTKHRSRA